MIKTGKAQEDGLVSPLISGFLGFSDYLVIL
jgi:hypothetical protein